MQEPPGSDVEAQLDAFGGVPAVVLSDRMAALRATTVVSDLLTFSSEAGDSALAGVRSVSALDGEYREFPGPDRRTAGQHKKDFGLGFPKFPHAKEQIALTAVRDSDRPDIVDVLAGEDGMQRTAATADIDRAGRPGRCPTPKDSANDSRSRNQRRRATSPERTVR